MKELRGGSLRTLLDYSRAQILDLLECAGELKKARKAGALREDLKGKNLAMIFQKPSLRTRVSFEVAMKELGGDAIYLSPAEIKIGERETTEDIAMVLSRYCHGITARVFEHKIIEDLAKYADIPVINGLSDYTHPCQILGDLLTILEHKKDLEAQQIAYVGAANNVANSWMFGAARLGLDLMIVHPPDYDPKPEPFEKAKKEAQASGAKIEATTDLGYGINGRDVIYTDVWASMGEEAEADERRHKFEDYRITKEAMSLADRRVIFMHCLPAHYGDEVTHEVAHGPRSVIFDEAENRLHAQKAVLLLHI